jgi:AcrR family transcriptional regulator
MARLTRAENQARTRQQLMDTARALFLRDGYLTTSLAKVADEAGFSTGAVYSNFASKAELALAVLDQIHNEELGAISTVLADATSVADKLTAFEDWAIAALHSGWPRLELEFAMEARHEPALVRAIADQERSAVGRLAAVAEQQLAVLGIPAVVSSKVVAGAVLSLACGLAVQHMIDPAVSPRPLINELRKILVVGQPL